jgi:UDP-N-acetylmuramate dehydrogenase
VSIPKELQQRGFSGRVREKVPLAGYTTYRIGGPAEALVEPVRDEDVEIVVRFVRDTATPLVVLGGGSKILAPDEGAAGIVMLLGDLFAGIEVRGETIEAAAGVPNALLAETAALRGLRGFEWICDIPGRVGGSLVQNAGMNECCVSGPLESVTFLRSDVRLQTAGRDGLEFGYRSSSFKTWGDAVIVSARFRLGERGDPDAIAGEMEAVRRKRHARFPVSQPTCGSVFKRPEGHFPGKLIEECGLGGTAIGGAAISTMHHNFIVNTGAATAADVKALVDLITRRVLERTGISLERELIYLEETVFRPRG